MSSTTGLPTPTHRPSLEEILSRPGQKPPPGVQADSLAHLRSNEWLFYLTVGTCSAFVVLFLLLRLYTKIHILRRFDRPDYFIVTGFLLFVAMVVLGTVGVRHGAGIMVHQWNIPLRNLFELLYWMNLIECVYGPGIFIVKMAILLQYLAMFAPRRSMDPPMFYGSWTVAALCFVFYTIDTFATIFSCIPREKIWNKLYVGGHCIDYHPVILTTGFVNIVTDLAILLLPVRSLYRLRIDRRRKIGITMLFGTGLVACIASIMRIVYTFRIVSVDEKKADVSFNIVAMGFWSYAEVALGIIVACALSMPKFIETERKRLPDSTKRAFSRLKSGLGTTGNRSEMASEIGNRSITTKSGSRIRSVSQTELSSGTGTYPLESIPSRESVR